MSTQLRDNVLQLEAFTCIGNVLQLRANVLKLQLRANVLKLQLRANVLQLRANVLPIRDVLQLGSSVGDVLNIWKYKDTTQATFQIY